MKKIFLIFLLSLPLIFVKAQNYKVKAILTYNFTKYITWNENDSTTFKKNDSTTFKIGVFGNNDYLINLIIISKNYKVSNKPIEVIEFNTLNDITECNMLYVIQDYNNVLPEIIEKIQDFNTLLLTSEAQTFTDELGINFILTKGKQQIEIYSDNIKKSNIIINDKLLQLGIEK